VRVLVVKLSSLGDIIHTLPALSDAAAALPGIRFDWVVEEAFAEVPQWHGAVDTVIPVAIRRWRKRPLRDVLGPEARRAHLALRAQRYDAVIDAQGLLKSALIARLVNAPRYGLDWRSARERLASSVYHHAIRVPRDLHAVQRIRLLFARALGYSPPTRSAEYGVCLTQWPGSGSDSADLVFVHGTARAEKLWPEEHWRALAALAIAQGYTVCLPWGSAAEGQRARRIAAHAHSGETNADQIDPGKTSLRQASTGSTDAGRMVSSRMVRVLPHLTLSRLAGVLRDARAAVAVDTGLGHLCAALDVPTVSLYGPTQCNLVGTCGRNQIHLQSPLGADATAGARMASLAPADVWAALQPLLAGGAYRPQFRGGE
jgi:heptosyltransferase-1